MRHFLYMIGKLSSWIIVRAKASGACACVGLGTMFIFVFRDDSYI